MLKSPMTVVLLFRPIKCGNGKIFNINIYTANIYQSDCSSSSSSIYNTDGGLSVPKQGFLNPFSTTRGLNTLLAGFAYRKMDLPTQNGLCEPLPEARYMMKSKF